MPRLQLREDVEQVGVVLVNKAIRGVNEALERTRGGVVAEKNEARRILGKIGGDASVGDFAGPKAFEHDDGKVGRHGNAGVEGVNRLVAVNELDAGFVAVDFPQEEAAVGLGRAARFGDLEIKTGAHPGGGGSQIQ